MPFVADGPLVVLLPVVEVLRLGLLVEGRDDLGVDRPRRVSLAGPPVKVREVSPETPVRAEGAVR